jgi:FkbM family methyltransferase
MHFSLVIIGAHDGSKTRNIIDQAANFGLVLLVEPVPHLFERLKVNYAGRDNILLLNVAISDRDSESTPFYAPTIDSNHIAEFGDQLGSLNSLHAISHHTAFANTIRKILVKTLSFGTLIEQFRMSSIDTLYTDTEGFDAAILLKFPFFLLRPRQILFEYKHSDGVFQIGRNLGILLILLDSLSYKTKVLDIENCLATRVD